MHLDGTTTSFEHELKVFNEDKQVWHWLALRGKRIEIASDEKSRIATGIIQDIDWKKTNEDIQLKGQEDERIRVSREIHDSIGQQLVGTRFLLNQSMEMFEEESKITAVNKEIDEMLEHLIKETRIIINNLGVSLFENESIKVAAESLIDNMQKIFKGEVVLDWIGDESISDPLFATNVFRIMQEGIANAVKYAHADQIQVKVSNMANFKMEIQDNGIGFNIEKITRGFGFKNIKDRAHSISGKVDIISQPGEGTSIVLTVN